MQTIISSSDGAMMNLPNWAQQLADLTRIAWSGDDGTCYFPYQPLTGADFWRESVAKDWQSKSMYSWVMTNNSHEIVAHAALIKKEGFWELGRWVALPSAAKGAVTTLCQTAMEFVKAGSLRVRVECTQAHTRSQVICERLGLRFAGIGILKKVGDVWWDIIYYDNAALPDFCGQSGIIANPLGDSIASGAEALERLRMISEIISTEIGGTLPPEKFHILPRLEKTVRDIISLNS